MTRRYYGYFIPKENLSGVTTSWRECAEIVSGKSGARYKSFKTKSEAEEWIRKGADYGFSRAGEPGIYFDAGTGRGNGVEASVTDENGKNLLAEILPRRRINKFGKYNLPSGLSNNYGELLAFKFALQIALKTGAKKIFGDSRLIINYWSKGFVKEANITKLTSELIDEVMALREKFEKRKGAIILIDGRDNPADLGFHR